VVRRAAIRWSEFPSTAPRSMWERIRRPHSALGSGLKNWLCANAVSLIHRLPRRTRIELVHNVLGPAGAWWLRDRVVDCIPVMLGHALVNAEMSGDRALVRIIGPEGRSRSLVADHVVAATGYRFDLRLLPFLSERLKTGIRCGPRGSGALSRIHVVCSGSILLRTSERVQLRAGDAVSARRALCGIADRAGYHRRRRQEACLGIGPDTVRCEAGRIDAVVDCAVGRTSMERIMRGENDAARRMTADDRIANGFRPMRSLKHDPPAVLAGRSC
jgi:hypothetical protein